MDAQEYRPVPHTLPWLGEIIPTPSPFGSGSSASGSALTPTGIDLLVDHPPHYKQGSIEVIDAIEGLGLADDYHLANAVKYICRCRHKGNVEQDIRKAIWYLERKLRKG